MLLSDGGGVVEHVLGRIGHALVAWWQAWDRQAVSDAAGRASFVVWLFAQSPQLYENYARSSVDGLSPIFLAQWMGGDVTNLVGCLLTHQLGFQIAVATYFCLVDACICAQYYYYWSKGAKVAPVSHPHYASTVSRVRPEDFRSLPTSPTSSRGALPRWGSTDTLSGSGQLPDLARAREGHRGVSHSPVLSSRSRTWRVEVPSRDAALESAPLSASGLSVAEYAALRRAAAEEYAARAMAQRQRSGAGSQRRRLDHWEPAPLSPTRERSGSGDEDRSASRRPRTKDYGTPAAMVDSFTSERSSGSERYGYGFGIASTPALRVAGPSVPRTRTRSEPEPAGRAQSDESDAEAEQQRRGRGMERTAERLANDSAIAEAASRSSGAHANTNDPEEATCYFERSHSSHAPVPSGRSSPVAARRAPPTPAVSASPSRRRRAGRGMGAFLLGLGALWGLGPSTGTSELIRLPPMQRSWTPLEQLRHPAMLYAVPEAAVPHEHRHRGYHRWSVPLRYEANTTEQFRSVTSSQLHFVSSGRPVRGVGNKADAVPFSTPRPRPASEDDWDRIIGRIFAWTCCVLYMTSRIPQIWSNYVRRSVEGLSILLFIAAAGGNTLYSISVLASPLSSGPGAREYLLDCLPFLLGSGGTLIFDAIIVAQFLAWRHVPLEVELMRIDEEEEDPLAPEPGSFSARPGFSRRSSIASAREDVERVRSISRPRGAAESLRRSGSSSMPRARRQLRSVPPRMTPVARTAASEARSGAPETSTAPRRSQTPGERTPLLD